MVSNELLKILQDYLQGSKSLDQLRTFTESYEWDGMPIEPTFEHYVMGTLELYLTEIRKGLRSEAEFVRLIEALFVAVDRSMDRRFSVPSETPPEKEQVELQLAPHILSESEAESNTSRLTVPVG